MSFIADKKREHETAAEKALLGKDYTSAFFHTAKAAEFGLALAEQCEGKLAKAHVDDAFELLEIAKDLKAKAGMQVVSGSGGPGETGGKRWVLQERPTERLSDVVGLEEVKTELRERVIEPFQDPELWKRFGLGVGGGILMYGPPGNGKTHIARAVAGELDAAFFYVNSAEIKNKYIGETEKNLQRLFDEARTHERAVLFFDECDHLLARAGNRKVGAVTQFLTLADGLIRNKNCLLILAATNKPWLLDEAVVRPGRIGTRIYVTLPDLAARESITRQNMGGPKIPLDPALSFSEVAARTDGYSGADLRELCERARRSAKNRQRASGHDECVNMNDIGAALKVVSASVTPAMVKKFIAWRDGHLDSACASEDTD